MNIRSSSNPGRWRVRGVSTTILVALLLAAGGAALEAQTPLEQGSGEEATSPEEAAPAPQLEELLPEHPFQISSWGEVGARLFRRFVDALPDVFYALIVLVAFFLLYLALKRIVAGMMERQRSDPALRTIVVKLLKYTLLAIALFMAAGQLGFQIGPVLASAGVIGLAVGLAAQDSLSNVIAGLILLWDRPFLTGDNVTIADTFGEVQHVGLRATHILTVDQKDTYIPNRQVTDEKIVNHTKSPRLRLDVPIGIGYAEDTREARRVLLAVAEGHELITERPEPEVVVSELGDSAVGLQLRVWLKDPRQERRGMVTLLEECKIALDEAGIEIPFPQRTLHVANERLVTDFLGRREAS